MNKGFTLIEVVAVILVIAVVATFAVPALSSIRAEVRHQQAKSAAIKMADALRSFYKDSQGYLPAADEPNGITGNDIKGLNENPAQCQNPASVGIPKRYTGVSDAPALTQLFYCGYLSAKDFVGLPYKFTVSTPNVDNGHVLVTVTGLAEAGKKYSGHIMYVRADSSIEDADSPTN